MKKFVLSLLAGVTPFAALAADLPNRKAPPPLPMLAPAFNWTGFYVGLNAGYADPNARISVIPGGNWVGDPDAAGVTAASARNLTLQGPMGGGQIGYNYQFNNNLVVGLEADIDAMNIGKSYTSATFPGALGGTYFANGAVNINYVATLRGRFGFAVDHWLFYVTGGLAVTGEKFRQSVNFTNVFVPPPPPPVPALPLTGAAGGVNGGSASSSAASWTLGAGVEYALTNNISAKLEYLYVDLKSLRFNSVYGPNAFDPGTYTMQHRARLGGLSLFKVGLNYRFGG